ncbi:hypothetical protein TNCV_4536631 [Trichonephila clavipes]|nr:hypothetical protein TNCV_4536631 [Trichonephila clavipes]
MRKISTLDQLLELRSISPWKQQTPPEQIYDELAALQSVFLHSNSKVTQLKCGANFSKRSTESAEKLCSLCSVPVSNAFVERIFSVIETYGLTEEIISL